MAGFFVSRGEKQLRLSVLLHYLRFMLLNLHIANYAIIDDLQVSFSGKLNAITGETGAGKSILVGALGLVLGERADTGVLVNKDRKCVVEGAFRAKGLKAVEQFLSAHDLDAGEELLLRREISPNGKSRAFVNDTPVNLEQLRQLSSLLVDLHQQFDTLSLADRDFQRAVVDSMADNAELLESFREGFVQWQELLAAGRQLAEQKAQFAREADYHRFQLEELESVGLREHELEEAESELQLLQHAEGIKSALERARLVLADGEAPLVPELRTLQQQLAAFTSYHPDLAGLVDRLRSAQVELQDIAGEVDRMNDRMLFDANKMESLHARLSEGYRLLKKHGVKTTEELLKIQSGLQQKLQAVLDIDGEIAANEEAARRLRTQCSERAAVISARRQKQLKPFETKVNKLLIQVGMPNARLVVQFRPVAELNEWGSDQIEFLFDANKSGQLLPVSRVASGGELSRLMLCIKSLVGQSLDLPTLIFDEIDAGISGEAAKQVGLIMKELAASRQIICITHQPQIAGKADAHYFVYKEIVREAVKTNIRPLSREERITAIAQMLSGEKPTAAALQNAREMVSN